MSDVHQAALLPGRFIEPSTRFRCDCCSALADYATRFLLTYVERCERHGEPAILITEIPDGFRIYKPNATYRIRTVESETLLRSIRHELHKSDYMQVACTTCGGEGWILGDAPVRAGDCSYCNHGPVHAADRHNHSLLISRARDLAAQYRGMTLDVERGQLTCCDGPERVLVSIRECDSDDGSVGYLLASFGTDEFSEPNAKCFVEMVATFALLIDALEEVRDRNRVAIDAFYRCDRERLTAIEERDAALEKLRRVASLVTDCGQHDCHETCRNSADWIRKECAQ